MALISWKYSALIRVSNWSLASSRASLTSLFVKRTELFASLICSIASCMRILNSASVSILLPILLRSSSKLGGYMNRKFPSRACLLISMAPCTSTSMMGILPPCLILSSSWYAVPYLALAFLLYYSMNSPFATIFSKASSVTKIKFCSAFSRFSPRLALVV